MTFQIQPFFESTQNCGDGLDGNKKRHLLFAAPTSLSPPSSDNMHAQCPASFQWEVKQCDTLDAALEAVKAQPPQLMVVDISLGGAARADGSAIEDPLKSLRILKERAPDAALVALIPDVDDTLGTARRAFMAGAEDVLTHSEARQSDQMMIRALRNAAEHRAADRAVAQIKRDNERLYENMPIGIFRSTPDGRYLSVNPALAELYGFDDPEQLITDMTDIGQQLYVRPERRDDFARMLPFNGRIDDFESEIRRRDGSIIWISECARAVHDENGTLQYYEGYVRDITQRRQAEQRLRATQDNLERMVTERTHQLLEEITERRLAEDSMRQAKEEAEAATRMKSRFLANMSHELRTPLNAILGFSQILELNYQNDPSAVIKAIPKHREYADNIHTAGKHLLSLINDLLDMAKIDAQQFELADDPVALQELVLNTETMIRPKADNIGCRIHIDIPDTLPLMRGDGRRLLQVLVNLASNAVKFTPEGGDVSITAHPTDTGGIQVRISDTGIGMNPADIPRALSEFGQVGDATKRTQDGTGLGLPLAKRLTELHDGRLNVYSEPGMGTDVVLTFPPERTTR